MKRSAAAVFAYSQLTYREQKKLLKSIPSVFHSYLYIENALPHDYNSFFSKVRFVPEQIMPGLGCFVMQMMPYREEINRFVSLKEQYEEYLLMGNYDRCEAVLDEIDAIGLSLWTLENRFLVKNRSVEMEEALAYKDRISTMLPPLATIMATLFWSKFETKYSLSPIEQKLNLTIRDSGFSDQAFAYYKYKALKSKCNYTFSGCMTFALMTSVFDIYELFLDIIVSCADDFAKEDKDQVRTMLSDLCKTINDKRLEKLNICFGFSKEDVEGGGHDELLRFYRTGDYRQVKSLFSANINQYVADFDAYDVYVKACIFLGDKEIDTSFVPAGSLAEQIIRHLFLYLDKGTYAPIARARLMVIANQLSTLKMGNCLYEKLMSYKWPHYDLSKYTLYDTYASISEADKVEGDWQDIIHGNIPMFLKQKSIALAYDDMCNGRMDAELVHLYDEAYFSNPQIVGKIDVKPLLERHDRILNILALDPLEACVFYALSNAPKHMVYHFFKKYIKAQKTQIPSELINDNITNFTPLLESFFYKVCILDILKLYIKKFPTSDSVLEERLKILTSLSKIQEEKKYLAEITKITRRQSTNKRVQDLDQRMIYVDENAIKETELTEVEKQFHVYAETENQLETQQYLIEAESVTVDSIGKGTLKVKTEKVVYKNLLFRQMFLDIRKQFLTSYNNGLDFYLSTRIRHGTLLTQLRSAFEDSNLVTNKQNGVYKDNAIIADRVLGLVGEQREQVIKKLGDFSKDIDEYILHIKNDVVQVQAKDLPVQYPNAAFNYDELIDENDITMLYLDKVSKIVDYVEFVEVIFAYLWEKTEILLEGMREILDGVKRGLAGKINDLESDVIEIVGENNRLDGFLEKTDKAREGISLSVEKVKKWFYRGKCDDEDFQMRDVFDACKESVSIHRNIAFSPSVSDNSETWIKGEFFRKISDLFLIFFNNILDYQRESNTDVECEVIIREEDNIINIVISNNLLESDVPQRKKYIEESRLKLGDPEFCQIASKEKGSGHFKAYNIIHSILPGDKDAFVMDVDDNRFVVNFKIDTTYLRVYETVDC